MTTTTFRIGVKPSRGGLHRCLLVGVLFCTLAAILIPAAVCADELAFKRVEIDPQIDKVCYGLTLADVNGDDRVDLVAVSDRAVYWYENPSWKKWTIIADQTIRDNVCIAPYDIDADGKVDFALGAGWTGTGTIQWLRRGDSLKDKWSVFPIATEKWTHRMRFADVLGKGRAQLVVSPLNRTVGKGVRLTAFKIPKNPAKDRWEPVILNEELNRMHNHWHVDFDGDDQVDTLTASEEGVSLIATDGKGRFTKKSLTAEGAGEIKTGKSAGGNRLLATIEPMHGNRAVVYEEVGNEWKRTVLEEQMKQGHAVWLTNLDSDQADEVVIGHREPGTGDIKGPGLYVFDYRSEENRWEKHVVDKNCAVEDCVAADFDGDGRMDLAAGGRATHNIVIYFNRTE